MQQAAHDGNTCSVFCPTRLPKPARTLGLCLACAAPPMLSCSSLQSLSPPRLRPLSLTNLVFGGHRLQEVQIVGAVEGGQLVLGGRQRLVALQGDQAAAQSPGEGGGCGRCPAGPCSTAGAEKGNECSTMGKAHFGVHCTERVCWVVCISAPRCTKAATLHLAVGLSLQQASHQARLSQGKAGRLDQRSRVCRKRPKLWCTTVFGC